MECLYLELMQITLPQSQPKVNDSHLLRVATGIKLFDYDIVGLEVAVGNVFPVKVLVGQVRLDSSIIGGRKELTSKALQICEATLRFTRSPSECQRGRSMKSRRITYWEACLSH